MWWQRAGSERKLLEEEPLKLPSTFVQKSLLSLGSSELAILGTKRLKMYCRTPACKYCMFLNLSWWIIQLASITIHLFAEKPIINLKRWPRADNFIYYFNQMNFSPQTSFWRLNVYCWEVSHNNRPLAWNLYSHSQKESLCDIFTLHPYHFISPCLLAHVRATFMSSFRFIQSGNIYWRA